MKNFTNNFKQFTSRLSARWLIMALMLLVGTSSAWAATLYLRGSFNGWGTGNQFINNSCSITLNAGTYDFKIGSADWGVGYGNKGTMERTNCSGWKMDAGDNCHIKADVTGTYTFEFNESTKILSVTYPPLCTTCCGSDIFRVAGSSNLCGSDWKGDDDNNKMECSDDIFSKSYNITGNTSYTFKIVKNNSDWINTINSNASITNKIALKTTGNDNNVTLSENPSSNGKLTIYYDPNNGIYATFEKSCTPATSITSAELQQDGTISLEGNFTTCGAKYHGFQWRKVGSNWCGETGYANNKESNYVTIGNTDVNGSETASFTPEDGGTYEFRTYIVTTSPWLYSTTTIKVSTCIELPDDAYALSSSRAEWTGRDITPTIRKKDENYPTPTITYNGGSALPNKSGEYTIKATVSGDATYCNKEFNLGTFTITCPSIAAPDITTSATVCAGTQVTLSNYNGVNDNTVKWYSDEECNSEATEQVTLTDNGTKYYAKAYHAASGCYSSEYSTLTFTVNPLPTINIGEDVTAVKFEDVVLTATGNNIADVTWTADKGTITEDATDPKKAILTYDQTGDVIVTATATSVASCTSTAATKTVKFSEEDCADVETTTTITTRKTKITYAATIPSGWSNIYCYAWNTSGNTPITNAWPGNKMVKDASNKYVIVLDIDQNVKFKVKFNQGNNDKQSTEDSNEYTGGYLYSASTITGKPALSGSTAYTETTTTTTTNPAPITAPAVKMVSAEYNETTDKIDAVAAIYKRGCANVEWGFQYSEDGITWSDKIHPNSHTATAVGEVTHSFSIDGGDGNTYYIRAYAKNSNSEVTSANTKSVEIPSKTIESATILLVDSEGEESDVTEVCPQSTVYLKVSYVGGDFKDYEAADDFPGTNLELVNHDKAKNEAIFSYTATATGVANITISNDNTSITTTNGVSITLKNVAPVNAPMISISQATICENGSATITVKEPIAGLTYTLYKETTKIAGPVIYDDDDDDLTFNVTEAGSYIVLAEESVCKNYANSMAVELKVVTSDVKIGLAVDKTTVNPWQPLKLTVTAPEGYAYTIDALNDVVYTQAGNVYTIKIPRPNDWSPGNSGDSVKTKDITFEAKIQVTDDLTCGSSSIKVKLEDTEENCK